MKKIIFSTVLSLLMLTMFVGCEKTSEGLTSITNYVVITLDGDNPFQLPLNETYDEPGFTAMEGETDVTDAVVIDNGVDNTAVGIYNINYAAANKDGFAAGTSRSVVVYDPTAPATDLTGAYAVNPATSNRDGFGAVVPFADAWSIQISKVAPGIFAISDFIGGWYDQQAGYGPGYAMGGHFKLNADNTLEAIDSLVPSWGDSMDSMTNAKYDPATKTLTYDLAYAGQMSFHIELQLK